MRWPQATRLIDRIKRERPELMVEHHLSGGTRDHYLLKICCLRKTPDGRQPVAGSLDTIYGPDGWKRYKELHPQPWCLPEESCHLNQFGREVNHRGHPVLLEPPPAPPISADAMLERIIALNRQEPEWRNNPARLSELAKAWGACIDEHGVIADFEAEEVARLSGECHASILIARTGSGLFTFGIAARWGNGGTFMQPTIGSVPFDTEFDARRAAFKDLIGMLEAGRGAARHQQRQLLIAAVKQRDSERGLFD